MQAIVKGRNFESPLSPRPYDSLVRLKLHKSIHHFYMPNASQLCGHICHQNGRPPQREVASVNACPAKSLLIPIPDQFLEMVDCSSWRDRHKKTFYVESASPRKQREIADSVMMEIVSALRRARLSTVHRIHTCQRAFPLSLLSPWAKVLTLACSLPAPRHLNRGRSRGDETHSQVYSFSTTTVASPSRSV
jgi:hypothetical protein